MAAHEEDSEQKYKVPQLLHPELLSLDDIRRILRDRCVAVNELHSMDKEHLVAILHRVAVPIPQRDCFKKSPTRRFTFNSNAYNKDHNFQRDLNSTNKRLSNCIDYNKKTIKLKRILDSCDEEDSQKVNSLKRLNGDIKSLTTQTSDSPKTNAHVEESPASKRSRVKISWP